MKSIFLILKSLFVIILCMELGCSSYQLQTFKKSTCKKSEDNHERPQNIFYSEQKKPDSIYDLDVLKKTNEQILTEKHSCRIKYHKLNSSDRNIVVEGKFEPDGKKYPVVLDTGASQPIFLNTSLVRKNKLPVFPFEDSVIELNGQRLGFCLLPELKISEVTLTNWICIYLESHTSLSVFGIPLASSTYGNDNIILGLPLLRKFKYVVFDNINKEAELSYYNSFVPYDTKLWKKYPVSIEEDFHGNAFLFVRFTIAGVETELQLDTGSGRGLAISERLWGQIRNELNGVNLKKNRDFYPYLGNLPCRKGKVPELEFGNSTIENANISVFPDNSPLLVECEGLVGMQYFQNNTIVLDFEHNLMWLRDSDI